VNSALQLFGRLQEDDVDVLFSMGRERRLEPGDVLLIAGEEARGLFVVQEGTLAVIAPTEEREVLATVHPGEVIGEIAFFDGAPRSMTVTATEPCTVLELPLDRLTTHIDADNGFGMRFHRALGAMVSTRIRRLDARLQATHHALPPDPAIRARAAKVAAANIARLRGRQNHPSLLLENRDDYVSVIANGLARTTTPATIAVVGAGLAGLSAAYELIRAGHRVIVVEASRRPGGRCYTLREPFAPGQYAEAGAMRFPSSHRLLFAYLDRFGIATRSFEALNPAGLYALGGVRARMDAVFADPLSAPHRARRLWNESIEPLVRRYRTVQAQGGNAWPALVEEYNELTLRDFLVESGWTEQDIAAIGLVGLGLGGYGALMNMAFLELFRLSLLGSDEALHEIVGGADQLPRALIERPPSPGLPALAESVRYGAKLRGLHQDRSSVTLAVHTAAGPETIVADYVLVTVPFPLLRFVDAEPRFSPGKTRAINELHYFSSTKVFLQFRSRFWEHEPYQCAGMVVTDLPIRALYLPQPSATAQHDTRSVVLASYTWESEARVWEALSPEDRVKEALRQVGIIFPAALDEFEVGASVVWNDPALFAGGAFAQYAPGQRGVLYNDIVSPEGRVHFAGEHTSFEHGWMEGAIESGLREALALHGRAEEEARRQGSTTRVAGVAL
jgi:monoamine oxidase